MDSPVGFSIEPIRYLYPFQSHFLQRHGYRYHYLDEGKGEPVIFLHGNPSWSFLYRRLILALRDSHRVIVPDHFGCGLSDVPDPHRYGYRLADRVADLEALLDHLGLAQNLTWGVHDWGGPIGMAWATRHPQSTHRLIVFNTAAFPLPSGKRLHWTLRFCRRSRLAAWAILRWNAFSRLAVRLGCHHPLPSDVLRGYTAPYEPPGRRIATLRFVQDIPLSPADPSYEILRQTGEGLKELEEVPVLICWGEQDFIFDGDFLEEWRKRFPRSRVHCFKNAGHYVLEDAAEEIIPLVQEFLHAASVSRARVSP